MIYSKLSLRTGGGIVSELQQAEQVKNTAALLIGLGGTGIDCLKEIKKQMRVSIKPDNPGAEVPVYEHIRFLAVDNENDEEKEELFKKEEIFDLSSATIWEGFSKREVVKKHKELDWMDLDKVSVSPSEWADYQNPGMAFCFRQAGRYRIMEHSDKFLEKLRNLIQYAKAGMEQAELNVHVFSGLGGTIGSGTFLDVCYLIRHALKEETGNGRLFGYFFLPDVTLAKIPKSATLVQYLVSVNGYASLQELDYCMRIRENGGTFTQEYKGGVQIAWNEPPVDYCCLMGIADEKEVYEGNDYQKVIKKTAHYIIQYLGKEKTKERFGLQEEFACHAASMLEADGIKEHGYHTNYYTIGMSCARVPMCEMNTYLAAKTFEIFSRYNKNEPTETEAVSLAEKAGIGSVQKILKEMMQDEKYADSLIARIYKEMDACAVDLNHGPAYAYHIVSGDDKGNLQEYVEGLRKELDYIRNQTEWNANTVKQLKEVLDRLKEQIEAKAVYYQKLTRIMNNLTETSKENLTILNEKIKGTDDFVIPLVEWNEIRPVLDQKINEKNMEELFGQLVQRFLTEPENWADENENKISKIVKDFFVKDAFSEFANRSMTDFLAEKYKTNVGEEITEQLYHGVIPELEKQAKKVYAMNSSMWSTRLCSGSAVTSVPDTEYWVGNAAVRRYRSKMGFSVRKTAFVDRIYSMRCFVALPVGAFVNAKKYENIYFEDGLIYRHLYIGKGGSELFSDWSLLPSIIPTSCMEGDIPRRLQKMLNEAKTIYTEAKEMQLIYGDKIRQFTSDTVQKLEEMKALAANVDVEGEEKTKAVSILGDVKAKLEASIKMEQLKYQDTEYSLPKGSMATEKIEENIREDYFVSSPALQTLVKRELEKVNAVKVEIQKIEKRMELLGDDEKEKRAFSQALLAGIIQWDRLKVSCTKTEYGIPIEIVLSDFIDNEHFPYAILPLYQAYISYSNLDEDTKNEIAKEADERAASFDDAFVMSVKNYAAKFTPEFNANFVESAKAIPEILEEARELVRSLNQELNSLYQAAKVLGL